MVGADYNHLHCSGLHAFPNSLALPLHHAKLCTVHQHCLSRNSLCCVCCLRWSAPITITCIALAFTLSPTAWHCPSTMLSSALFTSTASLETVSAVFVVCDGRRRLQSPALLWPSRFPQQPGTAPPPC